MWGYALAILLGLATQSAPDCWTTLEDGVARLDGYFVETTELLSDYDAAQALALYNDLQALRFEVEDVGCDGTDDAWRDWLVAAIAAHQDLIFARAIGETDDLQRAADRLRGPLQDRVDALQD